MKNHPIYLILVMAFFSSCASTKVLDTSKIKELVTHQMFTIESDIAQPMATIGLSKLQNSGILGVGNSSSNISLIGNSNFLTIKGDSISSYLPYYGERQSNVGYGSNNGGIEFEGLIKSYDSEWNAKKQYYTISFKAKSNNEWFDVRMNLYPNLKSYVTLNSASRTGITYIGNVSTILKEE
ncbi:DUF4251 domain-containing protein [Aureibaculum sp. A20]|uniref:DUF4251 domain-containing protein n=1 Tax=Aureibaculum flavum TaxID=2795986 RepID=A0ABS0WR92_9FLAO|nr:DUF4251 domain-containing protein [Aureibaculum flavum]MBJ2174494.1 DUF4251 domain-containing protein [Aureibaculum flavum]